MPLSNKVILVTGANRGIGAAIVQEMLKAGVAKIYATARDPETLPAFEDSRVVPLQLDITSDASINAAASTAKDIDVLVNNAGTLAFGDYISSNLETFEDDMQTNYFGTLRDDCEREQRCWPVSGPHDGGLFRVQGRRTFPYAIPPRNAGEGQHYRHRHLSWTDRDGSGKAGAFPGKGHARIRRCQYREGYRRGTDLHLP
jgi:NAD(P)-dependent dehydrogenase (short-subunit alcohol dehydrogenase family)